MSNLKYVSTAALIAVVGIKDVLLDLILNEKFPVLKYAHSINIHSVNGHTLLMDVF